MLSVLLAPLILLSSFAAAVPTPASAAPAKAYQIRGVQAPIYHLYLQALPNNASTPVMGPEASADTFNIGTTIQSVATSKYLNIGPSSTSYKPLTWDATANTTAWGLEGDTIITTQSSSYGRQLNFVVCNSATSGYYNLYLQTGSDLPSGTCSNYQTIHLPCLC